MGAAKTPLGFGQVQPGDRWVGFAYTTTDKQEKPLSKVTGFFKCIHEPRYGDIPASGKSTQDADEQAWLIEGTQYGERLIEPVGVPPIDDLLGRKTYNQATLVSMRPKEGPSGAGALQRELPNPRPCQPNGGRMLPGRAGRCALLDSQQDYCGKPRPQGVRASVPASGGKEDGVVNGVRLDSRRSSVGRPNKLLVAGICVERMMDENQLNQFSGQQLLEYVVCNRATLSERLLARLDPQELLEYVVLAQKSLPESQLLRMSGDELLEYVVLRREELTPRMVKKMTLRQAQEYQLLSLHRNRQH